MTFVVKNNNDEITFSYKQLISETCNKNKQSIEVKYSDIVNFNVVTSLWIAEEPSIMFPILNEVANKVFNKLYPGYYNI